jgi:nitroreductase
MFSNALERRVVVSKEMNRRRFLKVSVTAGAIFSVSPGIILAENPKPIPLLKPQIGSGNQLMQLLWKRMSAREFSPAPLPAEVLSNLLWAACGVNRPDGKRTAPTASNRQEIDVYAAMAKGLYLYDAKMNLLNPILGEDIRGTTGRQPFVKEAAVNLIYVADFSRMSKLTPEARDVYSAAAIGFISENVYLYCASEGLSTVVRGNIDKPALASVMKLRTDQKIILAQSIGYPKKTS